MKIEIWPSHGPLNSKDVFESFIDSLKRSGEQVFVDQQVADSDVAVIWSVLWQGRMRKYKDIWERYRKANKPVIVIEVGGIKRNETWKIGINGINREADFANQNVDGSRWKKFNVQVKPWKQTGDKIVICGQHTNSHQWRNNPPMSQWFDQQITEIRKYTNKPIVIRPHPRSSFQGQSGGGVSTEKPRFVAGTYDDFDLDFHDTKKLDSYFPEGKAQEGEGPWWCMINYNSAGPAFSALIAGVPIIVDSTSLAHEHTVGFDNLYNPFVGIRDTWYQQIAHTEYTVDEIQQGRWLERLSWAIKH